MSSLLGRFRGGDRQHNNTAVVDQSGHESPGSNQVDYKEGDAPIFDQRDGVHCACHACSSFLSSLLSY